MMVYAGILQFPGLWKLSYYPNNIYSTPPKYQDETTCYFRGFLTCWDSFKVSNLCLEIFWYIFSCQSPDLTFDFRPDRGSKWVGFGATLYGQGSRSWPEQQKLLFRWWWVRTQPQIILWQFYRGESEVSSFQVFYYSTTILETTISGL